MHLLAPFDVSIIVFNKISSDFLKIKLHEGKLIRSRLGQIVSSRPGKTSVNDNQRLPKALDLTVVLKCHFVYLNLYILLTCYLPH